MTNFDRWKETLTPDILVGLLTDCSSCVARGHCPDPDSGLVGPGCIFGIEAWASADDWRPE